MVNELAKVAELGPDRLGVQHVTNNFLAILVVARVVFNFLQPEGRGHPHRVRAQGGLGVAVRGINNQPYALLGIAQGNTRARNWYQRPQTSRDCESVEKTEPVRKSLVTPHRPTCNLVPSSSVKLTRRR